MQKYLEITSKILLGLPMVIFGLNKFLGFANVAPPEGKEAQLFLGTMFATYLAKIVGITEIVGGVLLFSKKTAFIGLLLLAPVIFNISMFHFAHDFIGNGIWIFSLLMFIWASFYHKQNYISLVPNS